MANQAKELTLRDQAPERLPSATSSEREIAAAEAEARAAVEFRYAMAVKRPRDWEDVRVRVMSHTKRLRFAEGAIWKRPVGGGTMGEGPSIRLVETIIQEMGNVHVDCFITYEDDTVRKVKVVVSDLERNTHWSDEILVTKTVERSSLKDGQRSLGERVNSGGRRVYLVEATEGDIRMKVAAELSKTARKNGLRLIPEDILAEAYAACAETIRLKVNADPDGERKRLADGFAALGVMPSALKQYLGHELGGSSPEELVELGGVYLAIKDGDVTWRQVMELRGGTAEGVETQESAKTKDLRAKLAQRVDQARDRKGGKKKTAKTEETKPTEPTPPPVEHPNVTDADLPLVCEKCHGDMQRDTPREKEEGIDEAWWCPCGHKVPVKR